MRALVTGASDGIGREMAYILSERGYELYVVSRNLYKLQQNFSHIKNCTIIDMDLSINENCIKLHDMLKDENIDIVINNAGVGVLGEFSKTNLKDELNMISLNITSVHILTKLFLRDFLAENKGYILNVSSIGGFFPSPLLSSYYATKSYVLSLTQAVNEEIRESNVYVGAFCPATIDTDFHRNAGARKSIKGISIQEASICAIDGMFKKKLIIIPKYSNIIPFFIRFIPTRLILKISKIIQSRKI